MKVLVLAAMLVCAVAQATDFGDKPHVAVRYDDLNLNSSRGVNVLLTRIERAAETACHQFDSRELSRQRQYATCIGTAMGGAVQSINNSRVQAAYNAQKKTSRAG